MTGSVQMSDDNIVAILDGKNLDWSSYALHFTLATPQTANVYNVYRFDIRAELFDKVLVSMSQTGSDEIADSYQYDGEYPQSFEPLNTNENGYLHGQI
jgi:hypothetical protein